MGTFSVDELARAEEAVNRKAAEYAYQCTNNIPDRNAQRTSFQLIKQSIILGARMFQEELMKDNTQSHETDRKD